jgi:mono/diheme cytochrome c family protein
MKGTAYASALLLLAWASWVASQEAKSYKKDVEPIFLAECGDCHSGARPKKGLDLGEGKGYASLVNKPSQEVPGVLLVKPGDPEGSYLWQKLQHTAKEGKGMPRTIFSSRKLPEAQLQVVKEWIETGANP